MCNIWQGNRIDHYSPEELGRFIKAQEVQDVTDVSLSGGEPFMRKDICDLTEQIIESLPNLQRFFLNTNGTYHQLTLDYVDQFAPRVSDLYVSISLEGRPETHNVVRGIRGYTSALGTMNRIMAKQISNVHGIFSTTITKHQTIADLEHVTNLAMDMKVEHTFRFADTAPYYHNETQNQGNPRVETSESDRITAAEVIQFIQNHRKGDRFAQELMKSLQTGYNHIMGEKGQRCKAGDIFGFIDGLGIARPCIYSTRNMGAVQQSKRAFLPVADLGAHEPCPCMTECTVYPMLDFS